MDLGDIGYTIVVEGEEQARAAIKRFVEDQTAAVERMRANEDKSELNAFRREKSIEREIRAYENQIRTVQQTIRALENLQVKTDPGMKNEVNRARDIELVNKALQQKIVTEQGHAEALREVNQYYQQLDESERIAALEREEVSLRAAEAANESLMASYRSMLGTMDPLVAAEEKFAAQLKIVNDNLAVGNITAAEAARVRGRIASSAVDFRRDQQAAPYLRDLEDTTAAQNAQSRLTAEVDRMAARVNSAEMATQMYRNTIATLDRALDAGAISQDRYNDVLGLAQMQMQQLGFTINRTDNALMGSHTSFQRWARGGIQQAGYQVADFAVQLQMGTSFLVAFGQQAPQLLGTLGKWGAIAGAIVAIGAALGTLVFGVSRDLRDLEDVTEDLQGSLERVRETMDTLGDVRLDEKMGNLAERVREVAAAFESIDIKSASDEMLKYLDELQESVQPSFLDRAMARTVQGLAMQGQGAGALMPNAPVIEDLPELAREEEFAELGFDMGLAQFNGYVDGIKSAAETGDMETTANLISEMILQAIPDDGALTSRGATFLTGVRKVMEDYAETVSDLTGSGDRAAALRGANEDAVDMVADAMEQLEKQAKAQAEIATELERKNILLLDELFYGEESVELANRRLQIEREIYEEEARAAGLKGDALASTMAIFDANAMITKEIERQVEAARIAEIVQDNVTALEQQAQILATQVDYGQSSVEARRAQLAVELDILAANMRKEGLGEDDIADIVNRTRQTRNLRDAVGELADAERTAASIVSDFATEQERTDEVVRKVEDAIRLMTSAFGSTDPRVQAAASALAQFKADAASARIETYGLVNAAHALNAALSSLGSFSSNIDAQIGVARQRIDLIERGVDQARLEATMTVTAGIQSEVDSMIGAGYSFEAVASRQQELIDKQTELNELNERAADLMTATFNPPDEGGGSAGSSDSSSDDDPLKDLREQIELEMRLLGLSEGRREVEQAVAENRSDYSQAEMDQVAALIDAHQARLDIIQKEQELMDTVASSMQDSFMNIIKGTQDAGEAFKQFAYTVIEELYRVLVVQRMVGSFNATTGVGTGLVGAIGGAFSGAIPFADGAAFQNGSVVSSPTLFPMSSGTGLMGEAGPEGILPLARTPEGKLGVHVASGGQSSGGDTIAVSNTFNITGSDEATVNRALQRALPSIVEATTAGVIDARTRGGKMKAAFGG